MGRTLFLKRSLSLSLSPSQSDAEGDRRHTGLVECRLDPAFYVCVAYHEYGHRALQSRLANFLGVANISAAIQRSYKESSRKDTLKLETADAATKAAFERLDRCSRHVDSICHAHQRDHTLSGDRLTADAPHTPRRRTSRTAAFPRDRGSRLPTGDRSSHRRPAAARERRR